MLKPRGAGVSDTHGRRAASPGRRVGKANKVFLRVQAVRLYFDFGVSFFWEGRAFSTA